MQKISLKKKLMRLFIITSVLPILILGVFSYYDISLALRENTEMMANNNLRQVDNNLNIWLESYGDLLYQIYTNDDMPVWADKLDGEEDEAVTINQMRRFLNALLNTKEYARAITVITPAGNVVTCEHMAPATFRNSWLANFSLSKEELYREVSGDYQTHIYPTEYGTNFANKDYYLFHMAHRIIDYKKLSKECGIVVLSIDEDLLERVCSNSLTDSRVFHFITDEEGRIISFGNDKSRLGALATSGGRTEEERRSDYIAFLYGNATNMKESGEIYVFHDEGLGWDIVNITDLSSLVRSQRRQLLLIFLIGLAIMTVGIIIASGVSDNLVASVKKLVKGMESAQNGDLSVRVTDTSEMPIEVEQIADGFNDTMSKLGVAIERQREAQIVAMEAQINPHFLYNTLDTINWMAIDKDEYDISNAINALATILRYAIAGSNAEVRVKDEAEWLKKYIYLQQYRVKNQFSCRIDVDPEVTEAKIHKLLLQPFIENAIIHGFDKNREDAVLTVSINRSGDALNILIEDNGVGMDGALMEEVNRGEFEEAGSGAGIGLRNAVTRLLMYYGSAASIHAEAALPSGTRIHISIPYNDDKSDSLGNPAQETL